MYKRRGECFEEDKICNDFKAIPKVTDSEKENWPVIMRSSSQSVHMEWKKEQEKIAAKAKYKEGRVSKNKKAIKKGSDTKLNKEIDKYEIKIESSAEIDMNILEQDIKTIGALELCYDSITSLRIKYIDSIILWIGDIETSENTSYCRFLLEYKSQYLTGFGQSSINMFDAVYNCVSESVSRIHEYPKFDIVVVLPMIINTIKLENQGKYDKIIQLLKSKSKMLNLFILPDRQNELHEYLCCNNNENKTRKKYADVVRKAKKELNNPSHYPIGKIQFIDCPIWQKGDQINLWTYWQGYQIKDLENGVDILLVRQDWGNPSRDIDILNRIKKIQAGEDVCYNFSSSPTDKRLRNYFLA